MPHLSHTCRDERHNTHASIPQTRPPPLQVERTYADVAGSTEHRQPALDAYLERGSAGGRVLRELAAAHLEHDARRGGDGQLTAVALRVQERLRDAEREAVTSGLDWGDVLQAATSPLAASTGEAFTTQAEALLAIILRDVFRAGGLARRTPGKWACLASASEHADLYEALRPHMKPVLAAAGLGKPEMMNILFYPDPAEADEERAPQLFDRLRRELDGHGRHGGQASMAPHWDHQVWGAAPSTRALSDPPAGT